MSFFKKKKKIKGKEIHHSPKKIGKKLWDACIARRSDAEFRRTWVSAWLSRRVGRRFGAAIAFQERRQVVGEHHIDDEQDGQDGDQRAARGPRSVHRVHPRQVQRADDARQRTGRQINAHPHALSEAKKQTNKQTNKRNTTTDHRRRRNPWSHSWTSRLPVTQLMVDPFLPKYRS